MVKSVETFHINIPDHYKDTAFRGHSSESACSCVYAGSITTYMQEDCMHHVIRLGIGTWVPKVQIPLELTYLWVSCTYSWSTGLYPVPSLWTHS